MRPATSSPLNRATGEFVFAAPVAHRDRRFYFPPTGTIQILCSVSASLAGIARAAVLAWPASAIETLWLASAILVPIAFFPWGGNAFELPKVILLRGIVLLMALLACIRFINGHSTSGNPSRNPPSPWLILPALSVLLTQIAATITSVNPLVSFWGSYERQQGLLAILAYLALFFFVAANLRSRAQIDRLLNAILWASTLVVLYGFSQAAGIDPLRWETDSTSPVLSTLGRSNFLGSYLTLVIPLTTARLVQTRRWPLLLLLLGQLVCLALTQARGAWIGSVAGSVALAFAWAVRGYGPRCIPRFFVAVLLLCCAAALLLLPGSPFARALGLDRVARTALPTEGSSAARLTIWQATLPLVAARPWLGYGPETLREVFSPVFPPQLVYYQGRNVPVDRAHNFLLDTTMATGSLGLIAWLALLGGFSYLAWRGLRTTRDRWSTALWSGLMGAAAGHFAELIFGFELTATATLFWLVLAIAAAFPALSPAGCPDRVVIPRDRFTWLTLCLPTASIFLFIGLLCGRPMLADNAFWNSQQANRPIVQRQSDAEHAAALWPIEPAYHLQVAGMYGANGNALSGEKQLAIADQLSPNDPQLWTACGSLYAIWANREPLYLAHSESAFRRAVELAPNIATNHTALGAILVRQGRLDDARVELERAVDLDATDGTAFHYLADLYESLGRETESAWARRESQRWGVEPKKP